MSRLPIRVKLTIAFAVATAAVLLLAAAFVYLRVSGELNDSIDEGLLNRAHVLQQAVEDAPPGQVELGTREDPEDGFSLVLDADGGLVDSTSAEVTAAALAPLADVSRTAGSGTDIGTVPGLDGQARVIVRGVGGDSDSGYEVVAASSTEDRDQTLAGLLTTFLIAAPIALLLASGAGYLLAGIAMRPVERMRRQAAEITLERSGEQLSLPLAHDEIHRLGETLNEMLTRIETSLERERSFVADASHELRTPLAIVRGELELGLRPGRDQAEIEAAMRSAEEEIERLQRLTDNLLTLARADDGRLLLELQSVSIPELLSRVGDRFMPAAEQAARGLTVDPGSSGTAELDPARIEVALGNLLENALRHGGGDIALAAREEGAWVIFEVSDVGPGMDDEFAARAFERFARAEAGRTAPGHGLGLAIVKAIAESHGGAVEIDQSAFGARVILRVPRGRADTGGAAV